MDIRINLHVFSYYEFTVPTYRIWVDNFLHVEREFPADLDMFRSYVNENIIVDLPPGDHTLTVEKVRPKGNSYIWAEKVVINKEDHLNEIGLDMNFESKQIIKFKI